MSTNYTINGATLKSSKLAPLAGDNKHAVLTSVARADARYKIALSAATEGVSNDITVTATVTNQDGTAVGNVAILFTTLSVTADKGDMTDGGTGAVVKAFSPSTGANLCWMTTVAGVAQVTVTDSAAEVTLLTAQAGDACNTLVLDFAAV